MKRKFLAMLLLAPVLHCTAQIKWSEEKSSSGVEWNNYSTTFLGDINDKQPLLVAAIPYNGSYDNMDANAALDLSFSGSLFRYKSTLSNGGQRLYTYDSGAVYFLTPGIFKNKASEYEYRILLNGKTEITPWTTVDKFSDLQLNNFKKGFGFLGGYKTTWGNYISAELRRKNEDSSFAFTTVYWKETKPVVHSVFTTKNLNEFFALLQRPWSSNTSKGYSPGNLVLPSTENTIVFYLSAEVFKKEAIEYKLSKDGNTVRDWGANDYDNNFIWLKELPPGKYKLEIRYTRQRQNIATYEFEIKPAWQQTTSFKIISGSLIAAFLGFIVLLFRNAYQKRKMNELQLQKEKMVVNMQRISSQLNPHFIFNALSSIQSLVNKNDTDGANEYLTAFSILLRQSLQYSEAEFIPVQLEAQMMETYLQLEQLRFHFAYTINVEGDVASAEVPVFIIQPLIENAVKHGVGGLQQKGKIEILFYSNNKNLCISIEDNGKGFDAFAEPAGYGLKLIKQRIKLMNQNEKEKKVEMSVSSKQNEGTKIVLTFLNWL